MMWWSAPTATRSRAAAKSNSSSPRQQREYSPQHHSPYHFQQRGLLSSGGACHNLRRSRYAVVSLPLGIGVGNTELGVE
jgi:hypothetical protein